MTTPTITRNRRTISRIKDLVPVGDSDWRAFGAGVLRSAGFPVEGLDLLSCPELCTAAQRYMDGIIDETEYRDAFAGERLRLSTRITGLLRREDFLSALTWQNRNVLSHGMHELSTEAERLSSRRRRREEAAALYWQRYCSKAETIGFFGPFAWIPVGTPGVALGFTPSAESVEDLWVCMEAWAVQRLGTVFSESGGRWWFPPRVRPDQGLDEELGELVRPGHVNPHVPAQDMRVLRLVDGSRNGSDILAELAGGPDASAWSRARVEKTLVKYVHRRFLTWDAAIPVSPAALPLLMKRVERIGDEGLRRRFSGVLDGIMARLQELGNAADHRELRERLTEFDEYYESIAHGPSYRSEGKAYAARTTVYMDATRPCAASVGESLLTRIAEPLDLVLRSAEWFGERLCLAFERSMTEFIVSTGGGAGTVADVWDHSLELLWGETEDNPLRTVEEELSRRWAGILGEPGASATRIRLESRRIRGAVHECFPRTEAPVPAMSVHSPDLQIVARSAENVEAGDYQVVLGELHACLATLEMPAVESSAGTAVTPVVRDTINRALGTSRTVPLFPSGWRRNTGRVKPARIGTGETGIGFTNAVAADPERVVPASRILLTDTPAGIVGTMPSGRVLTLREIWGVPLSILCADAFKIGLPGEHTPRLSIDDLVLFREAWTPTPEELIPPGRGDPAMDFVRVQEWRTSNGLPTRVFAKFSHETKPIHVDFTSPVLTASLVRMARRAKELGATAVISECLPLPEDNWLCDDSGQHYVSELRFQMTRGPVNPSAIPVKEES